ncbi:PREDICTED: zinc finger protein ZAT5-like [Ipomoea nil]|uniref:zinc finger protein ZAT5-like n=1 Tax=Ipomoea nil TaxID=35883 RepID=UPI000900BCD0|nr:PREDICTED: zinc finger protein ZAT5-like [Ipomoea nil]
MIKFDDHMVSAIKKRRTKRPRQPSPVALRMATSSSSSTIQCRGSDGHFSAAAAGSFDHLSSSSSPSSNSDNNMELSVDLEEDMANCLILLAQGRHDQEPPSPLVAPAANKEVYECKTCNRVFPSFQALGGHRASHKKLKATSSSSAIPSPENQESYEDVTTLSLQIPGRVLPPPSPMLSNKNRMHECSICGAEFTSGQALGGHMRRHRPLPPNAAATTTSSGGGREDSSSHDTKKSRNLMSFDLNLPAAPAEEERRETTFPFASSKERVIVFSTSTLVDCHY